MQCSELQLQTGSTNPYISGQAEHEAGLQRAAKASSKTKAKPKGKAKATGKAKKAPGDEQFPASSLPEDPIDPADGEGGGKKLKLKEPRSSSQEKAKIEDSLGQLVANELVDCGPPAMLEAGAPPTEFFKNFTGKCLIRIPSPSIVPQVIPH